MKRRQLPPRQRQIEFIGQSTIESLLNDLDGRLFDFYVVFSDFQPHLQRPRIHIRPRHIRDNRNQHRIARLGGRLRIIARGLHLAAISPPKIQFPTGVEADHLGNFLKSGGVGAGVKGTPDATLGRIGARAARQSSAGVDVGQRAALHDHFCGSGFLQSGERDIQIKVGGQRTVDQGIQFRVPK